MWILLSFLVFAAGAPEPVVIDRIAVIVGKHAIKLSDIERDLRLTAFLNRAPLDLSSKAKRQAAERLVDQQIIRGELAAGRYSRATDEQANTLLAQIRRDRVAGSDAQLGQALARYHVTTQQLQSELLWQLTVLQFIPQRFQPEVSVSDDDVRSYYDQHVAELRREHPQNSSFEALQPELRRIVEGEAVNKAFEDWIRAARERARIVYRDGAFQ